MWVNKNKIKKNRVFFESAWPNQNGIEFCEVLDTYILHYTGSTTWNPDYMLLRLSTTHVTNVN